VLRRARRTLADVATSAKKLELRIGELERQADNAADHDQARRADEGQAAGNVAATLAELRRDYAEVTAREERVKAASRRLAAEIDAFRLAKNAAEAAHTAAEEAAQSVWAEITVPSLDQQAEPHD